MTEKEKKIIRQNVKKSRIELINTINEYGEFSDHTRSFRLVWQAMDCLWYDLFPNEDPIREGDDI